MNTVLIAEQCGTEISCRSQAAALRVYTVARVERQGIAYLDFTGVRTIGELFADEFFGVLVREYGEFWFEDNVKVGGLSFVARATVLEAMSQRVSAAQSIASSSS